MKSNPAGAHVTFHVSDALATALNRAALLAGVPRSHVIRQSVAEHCRRLGTFGPSEPASILDARRQAIEAAQ